MKKILFILCSLFIFHSTYSQVNDSLKTTNDSLQAVQQKADANKTSTRIDTRPLKDRISFGLGTGFWITASQTYIEVTPVLAYRFPKTLITGIGYRYIYRHDRIYDRDLNAYGPNVFARVNLLPKIYLWTQYEILRNDYLYVPEIIGSNDDITKSKQTTDSWFAGLGFMKSVGRKGRGGLSVQVLYNFLYDRDDKLYYSPVTYQVGYFF